MTPSTNRRDDATNTKLRVGLAVALAVAWLSAGLEPMRAAVVGARAPSDFATDFVPAARITGRRPRGAPLPMDVATGNAAATLLGAPPYADVGVPFGAHPPPAVLLVAALVPLGFPTAALTWLLLSLAALAVVAWVSTHATHINRSNQPDQPNQLNQPNPNDGPRRSVAAPLAFAALLVWPPVLHNIEKGQWSLILAGLLAASWWAFTTHHDRWAGALIGLAAAFKLMPLLVLMAFIGAPRPRRRRVFVGAAATLLGAIVLSAAILGPSAWIDFVRAAPINTSGWQTGPANTLSLWGALARLMIGGPFARPIGHFTMGAPIAVAVWLIAAAGLVVTATRLSLRVPDPRAATPTGIPVAPAAFAAWSGLAVVLNPLSWSHGAALLVLPLALAAAATAASRTRSGTRRTTAIVMLSCAGVALTVPRMALLAGAGPWPVSPARGLFLALHLAAALTIVLVATRAPFDSVRPKF